MIQTELQNEASERALFRSGLREIVSGTVTRPPSQAAMHAVSFWKSMPLEERTDAILSVCEELLGRSSTMTYVPVAPI